MSRRRFPRIAPIDLTGPDAPASLTEAGISNRAPQADKRDGPDDRHGAASHWPNRGNLATISFAAFIAGAVTIGSSAVRIAETFGERVQVTLAANSAVPTDSASGPASIVSGTHPTAALIVTGLSPGPRLLLAGGILVMALTVVVVAAAIMYLCFRLGQGAPFAAALTRMLSISAWALILGGLGGQLLTGFGGWMVASELNADPPRSEFPFAASLDAWPFFAGIALRLIVAAFRAGERLQHETARAKRLAERLRRDTEGLV